MEKKHSRLPRYIAIFFMSILLRWCVLILAYLFSHQDGLTGFFTILPDFLASAGDAPHYLQIAATGYQAAGDTANNIVFYPLYPLVIRFFSLFTGNDVFSAIMVSNLSLGFAACSMYALLQQLTPDNSEHAAFDGLCIFLLYPFSMFLTGIYTESLFILLTTLCLLQLYRRRYGLMALTGFLAALTRAQGLILLLPAAYEWLIDMTYGRRKGSLTRLVCVVLIPMGTVLYLMLNLLVAGDAFAFVAYEAAPPWYNTTQWIAGNLTSHINMALNDDYLGAVIYWVQVILYFVGITGILAGLYKGEKTSFMAFGGAYICVSYLHGWLISGPRYMLGCIPLFLLACRLKPVLRCMLLVLFALLSLGYTIMYLNGGAIM